jgi:hypothetical protein
MNVSNECSHWNHVSNYWAFLGPPLKPGPEDIEVVQSTVVRHHASVSTDPYRVVLWGVTPELATMAWPAGTELLAIDHAERMIESVWPGDLPGSRRAVCGEWSETARISRGASDLIIGDGSLGCVRYPSEFCELTKVAKESLRKGGLLIMRLHAGPEVREEPASVVGDLLNLQIDNFHVFKFRFAMALQESPEEGVELHQILREWKTLDIDERELCAKTGWDLRVIRTIELYKDRKDRYAFPSLNQHLAVFRDHFRLIDIHVPDYEMGSRRPIVVLSRDS